MAKPPDNQPPELSVVVPLLNEASSIPALYREITDALAERFDYEVVFVDDGSTDDSYALLAELHRSDRRVRVIRLRRNFGQTAAMSAGFHYARGSIIVPMDADLQNDPADIPRLVEKLNEGYDIVSGWRKNRRDKAATRRLPSMLANKLIAGITRVKLHDFGCTLKAYRKEMLDETNLYGEMHRFIPALASWRGARITEMVVNHRARTAGASKYGLGRTTKVVLDLITVRFLGGYSTKPIYIFGGLGLISGLGAVLTGAVMLYQKFISSGHLAINRNPLMNVAALLTTTAIQFILMGLLAEILVRTYHESQGRPTYVIREVLDSSEQAGEDG